MGGVTQPAAGIAQDPWITSGAVGNNGTNLVNIGSGSGLVPCPAGTGFFAIQPTRTSGNVVWVPASSAWNIGIGVYFVDWEGTFESSVASNFGWKWNVTGAGNSIDTPGQVNTEDVASTTSTLPAVLGFLRHVLYFVVPGTLVGQAQVNTPTGGQITFGTISISRVG